MFVYSLFKSRSGSVSILFAHTQLMYEFHLSLRFFLCFYFSSIEFHSNESFVLDQLLYSLLRAWKYLSFVHSLQSEVEIDVGIDSDFVQN